MQLSIDAELRALCREIAGENRPEEEWAEIESDDMFQSESYEGGFDATEEAFCFSHHAQDDQEYWFQLTLSEVQAIAAGEDRAIEARPAGS
jgi:hypothetical protein